MQAFPLGCIVSRDGSPNLDTFRRVDAACKRAGGTVGVVTDPYSVAAGRNRAVADMLKGKWSHLWFVDDDVTVQQDALAVLLEMNRDIAAGCYPSVKTSQAGRLSVPYITQKTMEGEWVRQWYQGERELSGAGTGCMVIAREVFDSLGFPWFVWREEWDGADLRRTSDDMDFCERARAKGHRIFGHGNVRCGHRKTVDVGAFISHEGEEIPAVTWTGPQTIAEQTSWPGYGSHVPALVSIAKAVPIRSAVEYGSGFFSTGAFLNRDWFPDLEILRSHESDLRWCKEVQKRYGDDQRWECWFHSLDSMTASNRTDADLVLIDCDSTDANGKHDFSHRAKLIEKYEGFPGILVVHDANFTQIAPAVEQAKFRHKAHYVPESGPWTVVMSDTVKVEGIPWVDVPRPFDWR